jgi:hypothetical protein
MNKVGLGLLALSLCSLGCFKPNNTFEGMTPNNPVSEPSLSPSLARGRGQEFTPMVQESFTTSNSYFLSGTLGDKNITTVQKTQSGKYKVYLSVQGVKQSNPSESLKK